LVTKLALHGPNDSGDTRQESPNRQGEHQISSVRKDRRGEILILPIQNQWTGMDKPIVSMISIE
jgi:hypothetical protein